MIRLILLIASCFSLQLSFSQGVAFSKESSWQNNLKQAAASDKLLFIDVYTDWCKPCKEMDMTVFNKKEAGDRYNSSFINVKVNAEAVEGIPVAKQYQVEGYPTYLFVNAEGELVYRFTGLVSLAELLKNADRALLEKTNGKPIGQWMMEYPANKGQKEFMRSYLTQKAKLQLPASVEYDQYLSLLKPAEQLADSTLDLIFLNKSPLDIHAAVFKLLWEKYPAIARNSNYKSKAEALLEMTMRMAGHAVYNSGNKEELRYLLEINKHSLGNGVSQAGWEYEEAFYRLNKLPKEYLDIVVPQLEAQVKVQASRKETGDGKEKLANNLNNAAKFLAVNFTDASVLNRAAALVQSGIDMKPTWFPTNFLVWHTSGNILYKQGHKEQAMENVRKAISLVFQDDARFDFKKQFSDDLVKMEKGEKVW
jgi:thiol-disulfide isomerase/thioredoxin